MNWPRANEHLYTSWHRTLDRFDMFTPGYHRAITPSSEAVKDASIPVRGILARAGPRLRQRSEPMDRERAEQSGVFGLDKVK